MKKRKNEFRCRNDRHFVLEIVSFALFCAGSVAGAVFEVQKSSSGGGLMTYDGDTWNRNEEHAAAEDALPEQGLFRMFKRHAYSLARINSPFGIQHVRDTAKSRNEVRNPNKAKAGKQSGLRIVFSKVEKAKKKPSTQFVVIGSARVKGVSTKKRRPPGKDKVTQKRIGSTPNAITTTSTTTPSPSDNVTPPGEGEAEDGEEEEEERTFTYSPGYFKRLSAGDRGVLDDQNRHLPPMRDEDVDEWFRLHEKTWTHAPTIIYHISNGKKLAMFTKHKPTKPKRKRKKGEKKHKKKMVGGKFSSNTNIPKPGLY